MAASMHGDLESCKLLRLAFSPATCVGLGARNGTAIVWSLT